MLKGGINPSSDPKATEYIQEKLKSAVWLIKSIHQRQRTVYKVTESIVKHQRDFFEKGAGFLEGLLNILSNPESTRRLVNNITETDAATGQTYLKLPISNAAVVENALKVLSGLFGGMGKK